MDGLDRWVGRKIDGQTDKQTFSWGGGFYLKSKVYILSLPNLYFILFIYLFVLP